MASGKLIYKKNQISGSPAIVDEVKSGNMNAVTSNAVNGALTNCLKPSESHFYAFYDTQLADSNETEVKKEILKYVKLAPEFSTIILTMVKGTQWQTYSVMISKTNNNYFNVIGTSYYLDKIFWKYSNGTWSSWN